MSAARSPTSASDPSLRVLDAPSLFVSLNALFALFSADPDNPFVLVAALLIVPGFFLGRIRHPRLYEKTWNATSVAMVAGMAVAYVFGFATSRLVLSTVCLFLLIHRWYNERSARSHIEMWLLSVLLMLVAALDGARGVAMLLFLGWAIASCQLFNLIGVWRAMGTEGGNAHKPRGVDSILARAPHSLRGMWGMVPLTFVLMAGVFFAVPRLRPRSAGESSPPRLNPVEKSAVQAGFSDSIDLRSLSAIKETAGVAFNLDEVPETVDPSVLRFRVTTLDAFDGWQWTRSRHGREALTWVEGAGFALTENRQSLAAASNDWYRIVPVDLPRSLLPVPEAALAISGIPADAGLEMGSGGTLFTRTDSTGRPYRVLAVRFPQAASDFPLLRGEPEETELEIPVSVSAYVRVATDRIIPRDTQQTDAEKARTVVSYLKRNGVYSLELDGGTDGPENVREFLTTLTGHCELFATAMAMMLRNEGIPARIATGFYGAQRREGGGFSVGHRNAHAWVEAWIPGRGWLAYDPTPAPVLAAGNVGMATGLRDYLSGGWSGIVSSIENYDSDAQRGILREWSNAALARATAWEGGMAIRAAERVALNLREPFVIAAAALLAAFNAALWFAWPRWKRRRMATDERIAREATRRGMLGRILRKLGSDSAGIPSATPRETIAAAARTAGLSVEAGIRLADGYSEWRFGGRRPESAARISELLREIRIEK